MLKWFGCGQYSQELAIISNIVADISLTWKQSQAKVISLQGNPSAPFRVCVPNRFAIFIINNQTGQIATVGTFHGSGAPVQPGLNKFVYIDTGGNANLV